MELKSYVIEKGYGTETHKSMKLKRFWNFKSCGIEQTLELQKKCNWKSYGTKKGDGRTEMQEP
jgi:hypothetical protein